MSSREKPGAASKAANEACLCCCPWLAPMCVCVFSPDTIRVRACAKRAMITCVQGFKRKQNSTLIYLRLAARHCFACFVRAVFVLYFRSGRARVDSTNVTANCVAPCYSLDFGFHVRASSVSSKIVSSSSTSPYVNKAMSLLSSRFLFSCKCRC